ncbi:AAA family ATPase [Anoxynatronum sibiricum]|uniref:AAA family ATPase n=1 Tax=Anoxynatronum sibiricum TaxID=210623 RepID=A0ABU9VYD7_9CLOT
MEVTLFIGGSGTGKSYQAMQLAKSLGIRYIIDDGLLIRDNRVLGGRSAKRESSRLGAVRRAIFNDKEHCRQVRDLIESENPTKLLILGTSEKMVHTIVQQLQLPSPASTVWIDEVAAPSEIQMARRIRMKEGKHIIPVPAFQLKKDFSGFFLNPLQVLKGLGKDAAGQEGEKSVVRPTFSYLGKYTISDGVIRSLVHHALLRHTQLIPMGTTFVHNTRNGLVVELDVKAPFGIPVTRQLRLAQERIGREVENMTALHLASVNITIKKWM